MKQSQQVWIHRASYTYRRDYPESLMETLWVERPGWGFLLRRDLWTASTKSVDELLSEGFAERRGPAGAGVQTCSGCGMHICDIPGYLVEKHAAICKGKGENWPAMEESMLDNIRMRRHQAAILAAKLREQAELEEQEKRERHDRIREEYFSRQTGKDRKKRLKEETRSTLRKR